MSLPFRHRDHIDLSINRRMPSRFGFQFGRTNREFENIVRLTIA